METRPPETSVLSAGRIRTVPGRGARMEDVESDPAGLEGEPVRDESPRRVRRDPVEETAQGRVPAPRLDESGMLERHPPRRGLVRDHVRAERREEGRAESVIRVVMREDDVRDGVDGPLRDPRGERGRLARRDERVHDDDRALPEEDGRVRAVALDERFAAVREHGGGGGEARVGEGHVHVRAGYMASVLAPAASVLVTTDTTSASATPCACFSRRVETSTTPLRERLAAHDDAHGEPDRSMSLNLTPGLSSRSS